MYFSHYLTLQQKTRRIMENNCCNLLPSVPWKRLFKVIMKTAADSLTFVASKLDNEAERTVDDDNEELITEILMDLIDLYCILKFSELQKVNTNYTVPEPEPEEKPEEPEEAKEEASNDDKGDEEEEAKAAEEENEEKAACEEELQKVNTNYTEPEPEPEEKPEETKEAKEEASNNDKGDKEEEEEEEAAGEEKEEGDGGRRMVMRSRKMEKKKRVMRTRGKKPRNN